MQRQGELGYIAVNTKNYDTTLTPAQRQVAEWAFGQGEEFKENMGYLSQERIGEALIRVLSLESIKLGVAPHPKGRPYGRGGAIAQICTLSGQYANSHRLFFSAADTERSGLLLKGQVTEAGAVDLQREQSCRVNDAYEVLFRNPVTAVESARLNPKYARLAEWIGGIIFMKH